ncbi:MAG TPA: hypothetical protein PK945_03270 [Bacillota bacterium]|mgnify:CR=1 FL=1|jgi:vacuolar-type H+-ATPase subunit I/STV1|nr:hypothetical protein [Bacillota bacterium]
MTSGHSKASRKQSAEEELDVGNVSDEKMSELSAELERLQKERARLEKLLAEKEVEQAILKGLLALSNKKKRKRKKRNS